MPSSTQPALATPQRWNRRTSWAFLGILSLCVALLVPYLKKLIQAYVDNPIPIYVFLELAILGSIIVFSIKILSILIYRFLSSLF
jgi:hypothetical protein